MTRGTRSVVALAVAAVVAACFGPDATRPGLHLRGDAEATPSDWSFTNEHREIALEVHTPYMLPHSVTIWCAELDGALYVGASDPETKRWPGWADRDPDVRLGIGDRVFDVRLEPLEDEARIARLRRAYAAKYDLPATAPGEEPSVRYWQVEPRG